MKNDLTIFRDNFIAIFIHISYKHPLPHKLQKLLFNAEVNRDTTEAVIQAAVNRDTTTTKIAFTEISRNSQGNKILTDPRHDGLHHYMLC